MEYANRNDLDFQRTSDLVNGARRRHTFSFPLVKSSLYMMSDSCKGRDMDDLRKNMIYTDMMEYVGGVKS